MAYEIALRTTNGASSSGAGVNFASTKCRSAIAESCSFRNSWSAPTNTDFGAGMSLRRGYQSRSQPFRHSLRPRVIAQPGGQEGLGSFDLLTTPEIGLAENSCAHQSTGPDRSPLEKWLENYLAEIVRHLPEAPFLQLVPHYNEVLGERYRVSEELFEAPENWQSIKHCLLDAAPDGMILVHRLDQEALSECCLGAIGNGGESSRIDTSLQAGSSSVDVWGVLVHGCKTRCNACYILKTTRVAASYGVMTHFCLSRAKCFGPSIKSQLQSAWLL